VSQTSRSNVRPVKGVWNSPSAPERPNLLRLTLRAQSRSETGTARFKNSRLDISITQKMTNGNNGKRSGLKDAGEPREADRLKAQTDHDIDPVHEG
jgi:hypothetical protein